MTVKIQNIIKSQLKTDLPDIWPGDLVKVHQKITLRVPQGKKNKQEARPRKQVFEGIVIAKKHGKGITATITVRKEVKRIGVEKIFPIHSPTIEKIEILQRHKVRRAKLYYLRTAKGKKARLRRKEGKPIKIKKDEAKKKKGN